MLSTTIVQIALTCSGARDADGRAYSQHVAGAPFPVHSTSLAAWADASAVSEGKLHPCQRRAVGQLRAFESNGKPIRIASATTAGASFSSARLIVTARFIYQGQ
jgi:hypothetical protein